MHFLNLCPSVGITLILGFLIYKDSRKFVFPSAKDVMFFRTFGSQPDVCISGQLIQRLFQFKTGKENQLDLPDNQITTPDLWMSAYCQELLEQKHLISLRLDSSISRPILCAEPGHPNQNIYLNRLDHNFFERRPTIEEIDIPNTTCLPCFTGLRLGDVTISISGQYSSVIHFSNCTIRSLNILTTDSEQQRPSIYLVNCHVSNLMIEKNSCRNLELAHSSIAYINCAGIDERSILDPENRTVG